MDFRNARPFWVMGAAVAGTLAFAAPGYAQSSDVVLSAGNADYQDFFRRSVCGIPDDEQEGSPPSSTIGERCRDTAINGGQVANISGDSESSLTPSQAAIGASSALMRAKAISSEVDKILEDIREEEEDEQEGGDAATIASFGPWSLFANVEGEWFEQDRPAYSNERGFDGDRFRATIGTDYRIGMSSHVGLMVHYEGYSSKFDKELPGVNFIPQANAGSIKSETIAFTAFMSHTFGENLLLDASAGYGWTDNEFRRNAVFQPSSRTLLVNVNTLGKADGDMLYASAGLGYDAYAGALAFGPYVRGRYVRTTIDAYQEADLSNSALNLNVSKQKATSLTSVVGARASYAISTSFGVVLPQVRFEFEHEYKDDPRVTLTSFVNDPRGTEFFAIINDAPDRNYFNAGAGLVFVLPNGVMPFVDYEALLGYRNFDRHRVTAGIRFEF